MSDDAEDLPAPPVPVSAACADSATTQDTEAGWYEDDSWDADREADCVARLAATGPALPPAVCARHATKFGRYWDAFYRANATNFFKDRHYLEEEFPILCEAAVRPFSLLELGCGVGNAFYPLVERLACLSVTACDVSRRAVALARSHPTYEASGRVCVFACDAAGPGLRVELEAAQAEWRIGSTVGAATRVSPSQTACVPSPLGQAGAPASSSGQNVAASTSPTSTSPERHCADWGSFDAVLMLFVASALAPADHARLFAAAASALRPGGRLLFRDYGVFDEAELRFRPGSRLGEHLFLRGDGTLAAFFSLPGLAELAEGAGLEVAEARYVLRRQRNRRLGTEMRRVFVQAQFRRPDPLADAYVLAAPTLHGRAVG